MTPEEMRSWQNSENCTCFLETKFLTDSESTDKDSQNSSADRGTSLATYLLLCTCLLSLIAISIVKISTLWFFFGWVAQLSEWSLRVYILFLRWLKFYFWGTEHLLWLREFEWDGAGTSIFSPIVRSVRHGVVNDKRVVGKDFHTKLYGYL